MFASQTQEPEFNLQNPPKVGHGSVCLSFSHWGERNWQVHGVAGWPASGPRERSCFSKQDGQVLKILKVDVWPLHGAYTRGPAFVHTQKGPGGREGERERDR